MLFYYFVLNSELVEFLTEPEEELCEMVMTFILYSHYRYKIQMV